MRSQDTGRIKDICGKVTTTSWGGVCACCSLGFIPQLSLLPIAGALVTPTTLAVLISLHTSLDTLSDC